MKELHDFQTLKMNHDLYALNTSLLSIISAHSDELAQSIASLSSQHAEHYQVLRELIDFNALLHQSSIHDVSSLLSQEVEYRVGNHSVLQQALSSEAETRQSSDVSQRLIDDLNSLLLNSKIESTLSALQDEASTRASVDTSLSSSIDSLNVSLSTAITTETSDRIAALAAFESSLCFVYNGACYPSCTSGFLYNDLCISLNYSRVSFDVAHSYCNASGGALFAPSSAIENFLLREYFFAKVNLPGPFWLGIHDSDVEGTFVLTNSSSITYSYFSPDDSNDVSKNCVAMDQHGEWLSSSCSDRKYYF
eukprot:CAMPEP_0117423086 /NCGR_PEP_ID=MMETSP0758-20121206/3795_1 /TAXON_ID=63605 /ORGANISM="Percolomonas cosmopolitus, Strain AE-1 (ATCC 50343)" /LENGTH=306 /DNA_ID=CAMNT_0005206093 /DNA_START=12123 /DNA_END=13040 /DNA_ORIENTATION=+